VLWAQRQLGAALDAYRECQRLVAALTARDPDNAGWQRDLAASHNNVGGVLQDQGQTQAALREYEAALRIAQRLVALDPTNAQWQADMEDLRFSLMQIRGLTPRLMHHPPHPSFPDAGDTETHGPGARR
jgi:tetratricopeptide (TPR) repeat protein